MATLRISSLQKRTLIFISLNAIIICLYLLLFKYFGIGKHDLSKISVFLKPAIPYFSSTQQPTEPKKLKIGILTFYTKDEWGQDLKNLTFSNFKEYAKVNGYKAIDALDDPNLLAKFTELQKSDRPGGVFFFKAVALRYFLPKFDWLMWADGDSIFLNHTQKIEEHIDPEYDAILATGAPNSKQWARIINAGHYLIKNSQFSMRFLKHIDYYSQRKCQDFSHEAPNGTILNGWLDMCNSDGSYWLSDQGVMQWLFTFKPPAYKCHFKLVNFRDFNSEFPWYEDGDLVVHFPGRSLENRKQLIGLFYKYANFTTGIVDRTNIREIKPLKIEYSDWQLRNMTEAYKVWNTPCSILNQDISEED